MSYIRYISSGKSFHGVPVHIIPEEDGTYSSIVITLPGCGSCGDTMEEALDNAREAYVGIIQSYLEHDRVIPWMTEIDAYEIDDISEIHYILVEWPPIAGAAS